MSDHDTLRWGDSQTLLVASTGGESAIVPSKQMLNAVWQRPVVWRLMLTVAAAIPAGETVDFDVKIDLFVGVGGVNQIVPLTTVTLTNAGGYAPSIQFFDIPAEAMQVKFTASVHGGGNPTLPSGDAITVTALCAPHAEPGAIAQMRDHLGAPRHHVESPDQEGLERFMGPGFNDGQMRYR